MSDERTPEQRRSDAADEYERMHPYSGTCSKHGGWSGSYDECPECMEEGDREAQLQHEMSIPNSICWGCTHCEDEPGPKVKCSHYGFPMRPIKKKCKYFDVMRDDPGIDYPDYEDGMEDWDES